MKSLSRKQALNTEKLNIDIRSFEQEIGIINFEGNKIKQIEEIKRERRTKILQMSSGVNKVLENKKTEQFSPIRIAQRRELLKVIIPQS